MSNRFPINKPRGQASLFKSALAGVLLLAVAEVIGELAPAHVVHVAFGFMGMLFIDIALGLGHLPALLISRGLVGARPAWAQAVAQLLVLANPPLRLIAHPPPNAGLTVPPPKSHPVIPSIYLQRKDPSKSPSLLILSASEGPIVENS